MESDDHRSRGHAAVGGMKWRCAIGVAAVGVFFSLSSLSGCKTAPILTEVTGNIQGATELNPSVNQRPSPLLLRLYELKSATTFNQADFMALYQADQATLGADLVAREEIMLAPGEARPYKKSLAPETRFIGVVAVYRNLESATWRTIVPVQSGKAQRLTIRAESLAVSASLQP